MELKKIFKIIQDKIIEAIDLRKDENVVEDLSEKTVIPPEYLQRFGYYPIENAEQLYGRDLELELLKKAYDNWKISKNMLLVIGEQGTGVSSLINSSCHLYPHAKVINESVEIGNTSGLVKELSKALNIEGELKSLSELKTMIIKEDVVIIENLERTFLRTINGFSQLDDLLLFMHETKHLIYWVCTISRYSHYYLNQVKGINANFLSQISVKGLSSAVINDIIEKRNEGFVITILKPKGLKPSGLRKLKKASPEEQTEMISSRFYRKLNEYAGGNVSRAFNFWMEAIVHIREKIVFVREPEISIKDNLSEEDLFVLEAILQHTYIKLSELKTVLRNTFKASMLILEQLMEKDLVVERTLFGNKTVYQINLEYLEEVKSLLRTRLNRNIK